MTACIVGWSHSRFGKHEGEDIEMLQLPIDQALAMISDGRIADAKTIMLLQYAALHIFR